MSTVIANGFRYTGPNGLVGCHAAFNDLRPEVERRSVEKYINFIANVAVEQIDRKVLGLKPELRLSDTYAEEEYATRPMGYALELWDQRRRKHAQSKDDPSVLLDHAVATECVVHLFPVGRRVIGILAGYDTTWMENLPFITGHEYWNNSDRPDSISAREWSQRAKDWRDAFPTYPSERSLMMELHSKYEPYILIAADCAHPHGSRRTRVERVLQAVPSAMQRAKLHSRAVVLERKMWSPELSRGPEEGATIGEAARLSHEFHAWRRSPEGLKAFEEVEAELALKLPNITETLLKNNA